MFKQTHPIIGTRDMRRAIAFYTEKLRFELTFGDEGGERDAEHPNYVGYRRDAVELHMQFQYPHEMGTIRLRLLVEDPTPCTPSTATEAWNATATAPRASRGAHASLPFTIQTNALTFYRDLTPTERSVSRRPRVA